MNHPYPALATLFLAALPASGLPVTTLDKNEILEQFTNKEVSGHHDKHQYDFSRRYYGDGRMTGNSREKRASSGTWRVSGKDLCETWDGKEEKCRRLEKAGNEIKGYNKSGILVLTYATFNPLPDPANVEHESLVGSGSGGKKHRKHEDSSKLDMDGKTPLILAVIENEYDRALELIEKGADINQISKADGSTPLIYAASAGNQAIVDLLLKRGAEVNQENHAGNDALRLAALNGHSAITQALISNGADVNSGGFIATTPLINAAARGATGIGKLLLDNGADGNRPDNQGNTPLMVAALNGNVEFCRLLLAHGAGANARNNQGQSVIFLAAYNGNEALVQTLIDQGADARIASESGRTPVHAAAIAEQVGALSILFKAGYEPSDMRWESEEDLFAAGYSEARYGEYLQSEGQDDGSVSHYGRAAELFHQAAEKYDTIAHEYSNKILMTYVGSALSIALAGAAASYQAKINTLPTPEGGVVGFGSAPYTIYGTGDLPELREQFEKKAERARELEDYYRSKLKPAQ